MSVDTTATRRDPRVKVSFSLLLIHFTMNSYQYTAVCKSSHEVSQWLGGTKAMHACIYDSLSAA
jgi:hypothetical protein